MGKHLYLDPAAEKEATDIGRKFMHSTDVVGDMSRAYGADLSSVRIHTDESAARRTAERGVDAFSTGRDIFFARGAFDRGDSASRGLLAHELGHSLQQGVGLEGAPAMAQSAPMGAAQGGLLDWYRAQKAKKRAEEARRRSIEEMEISDPTPQDMVYSTNDRFMPSQPYTATNDRGENRSFMSYRSYVLSQMLEGASREQLQSEAVRKAVQEDYTTSMNSRLRAYDGPLDARDAQIAQQDPGELHTLGKVLGGFVPEDFSDQVIQAYGRKQNVSPSPVNGATFILNTMNDNEPLMEYMGGLGAALDGVEGYDNEEERSGKMIDTFMQTVVSDPIAKSGNEKNIAKAANIRKALTDDNSLAKNGYYDFMRLRGLLSRWFGRRN